MATISRRWRQGAAALILGGLAGLTTFAVAAMMDPVAGAMLRGLGAVGASPAVVERAAHEAVLGDLAAIRRDLVQARAARDRTSANLAQARQAVALARADRDEIAEELAKAGLRIAAVVASNSALKERLDMATMRQERAARKAGWASARISRRTANAAARNALSLPAELVPFLGIATILAVTTLDLYDACSTVQDMNDIREALDLSPLNDVAGKTCDMVPDFGGTDCREQVAALREQGLDEDAEALAATCEES